MWIGSGAATAARGDEDAAADMALSNNGLAYDTAFRLVTERTDRLAYHLGAHARDAARSCGIAAQDVW
jgi:hypothetical protein